MAGSRADRGSYLAGASHAGRKPPILETIDATEETLNLIRESHANCGVGALVDLSGQATHQLVTDGLRILANLDHRGARGAEDNTGDGAGVLLQTPHALFADEVPGLPAPGGYGVAQAFLPRDERRQRPLRRLIESICRTRCFELLGWRRVPTEPAGLGRTAADSRPTVWQFFVAPRETIAPAEFDLRLYVLRRSIERAAARKKLGGAGRELFYLCCLDRRTIVYKGLLTSQQLRSFYPDLADRRTASALVLLHARFSTNTLGSWDLAHPYRCLVHNGEINTLRGNLNWMRAHEAEMASQRFGSDLENVLPITSDGLSDSALFDNVLELLVSAGRSLPHALRMMIPEAWDKDRFMGAARRDFYAYHAALMEPWDGPALVVATDGTRVAAILDRNGLRPCRYCLTRDRRLILASETGVLEVAARDTLRKDRLKPGQLLLADLKQGRIIPDAEIFAELTTPPYGVWLRSHQVRLRELAEQTRARPQGPTGNLERMQQAFGYTTELLRALVLKMAEGGKDPIGAMGDDTPPAVLSERHRPLFAYFKQQFAQVSNPPLDYIREALVTSLAAPIGRRPNLLVPQPTHCRQLLVDSPVLSDQEMAAVAALAEAPRNGIRARHIDLTFTPTESLRRALDRLCAECIAAIHAGCEILILADTSIGPSHIPIPCLLAVSAVHHHLIRSRHRMRVALVVSSGEPAAVHHICTLLGYGADAVHPWLAYRSLDAVGSNGRTKIDPRRWQANYRSALEGGLLKVMAKMGISTLAGYKGAQIFEAIGLAREFVAEYFTGTACSIYGAELELFERETRERHERAYSDPVAADPMLEQGGELYWRRDGERHHWNPYTIGKLQQAARENDRAAYRDFATELNDQDRHPYNLRGLLEFAIRDKDAIDLGEVEPVSSIVERFASGSMSFGALSREAHEALAVAMNRIGGKSGTGEGGEQVERFGTERACSMKQVASGRFGVTAHYLAQAKQIEIKMAQGSKPGEGGELPGAKVDAGIAKVRFTVPGIGLISPPPHHDIYSIEDLAQLIHDLKCANPAAEIHVKLVAKAGVGTIAAGVAKGRADAILISGDTGGTGASMKTSIKSTGSGWEVGLAETHRVLMENRLRSRVRLRADGGLLTGRDVVIAALLGAEEYGFGTAPLVALGCVMLRKCHCNTCSVGIATQDPELRRKFAGAPEHVINYLRFVAEEVRELMARLGFRTLDDMIGRVDRLRARPFRHAKGFPVDVSELLRPAAGEDIPRRVRAQDHRLDDKLDLSVIENTGPALERGDRIVQHLKIRNRDRTFGTLLSYAITQRHGAAGLPDDTIRLVCTGSAGQSFGAFLCRGITLRLLGDANDYVGKGLSGGHIIVAPPGDASFAAEQNVIIGNVALYGATSGEAYINGQAGERFAVRNSGARAVVEGVGDHGCEYMTGGVIVILGPIGRNFGAGMSGGEAYIYDPDGGIQNNLSPEPLHPEAVTIPSDAHRLRRMLQNHLASTGSAMASRLLGNWQQSLAKFRKIMPESYARALERARRESDIRVAAPPAACEAMAGSENHPNGFQRHARAPIPYRDPRQRVRDFDEIYVPSWDETLPRAQGERCMDCGMPSCMGGCPIGNIIPEWNDLVFRGAWREALDRLHATNNFPEFTGYACPAPCENACTLAINADPVAIKTIERAIVDRGWEAGWIVPQPPKVRTGRHVAVVGSGPAGLAAAQQLNRAGHNVTVFEREDAIGGLMVYGIPDFKFAKHRVARRVEQLADEGIAFRTGAHIGVDIPLDELRHEFDAVCLAVGALAPRDVNIPGRELKGIHFGMDYLVRENRRQAGRPVNEPIEATGRRVVVLGGGDTGADCVATARRQGAAKIVQVNVNAMPPATRTADNPWPAQPANYRMTYAIVEGGAEAFALNSAVFLDLDDDGHVDAIDFERVDWERDQAGRRTTKHVLQSGIRVAADLVLIAIGFAGPQLAPFAGMGLETTPHGTIATDTSMMSGLPGVFVAGDARRGPSLIVWAIGEGREAARAIDHYLRGATRLPLSLSTPNRPIPPRGL